MPVEFVRVKIPETGAEWDAPKTALKTHPTLIVLDKPAANPPTSKPRRELGGNPKRRAAASAPATTDQSAAAAAEQNKE